MFWLMLFVANYSEHDVVIMLPTTYATEPWAHCTAHILEATAKSKIED